MTRIPCLGVGALVFCVWYGGLMITSGSAQSNALPRDLLILLDNSLNVSPVQWSNAKRSLVRLVDRLCGSVGFGGTRNRIAMATFSSRVLKRFDFHNYAYPGFVFSAMSQVRQTPGDKRCLADAIVYGRTFFSTTTYLTYRYGARPKAHAKREVLILTSGPDKGCPTSVDLQTAVHNLQTDAYVYALNVTNGEYSYEGFQLLHSLSSKPLVDHLFSLSNVVDVMSAVDERWSDLGPGDCIPFELS